MSDPNAQPSYIRGLPEVGQDPGKDYNPNAPANLDWGEPGTIPIFKPGVAMNVRQDTYQPTEEQIEAAQAAGQVALKMAQEFEKRIRGQDAPEPRPVQRYKFCPYCRDEMPDVELQVRFCPHCGEQL